ncbi:MAG: transporter [Candidatus Jettenia sp. CY-1]|nr:MAG: transporter [Candidatus Jettenia sp. CY-1]
MRILAAVLLLSLFTARAIYAHGECCLSGSLSEATISGITLAPNFGISLQYEYTNMKTIRDGTNSISHNDVLEKKAEEWPMMPMDTKSFSIPTRMIMQKYTLLGVYSFTEKFQFLATVPYVKNDMNMRSITRNPMGMDMIMDMEMDTVEGLGDVTLMGLYTLYTDAPVLPTKKLTLGLGVKTPTGENDEKTDSGKLVHAVMQPGTGSWDPLLFVNYVRAFYPWVFQVNFLYQLTTEGDEGYEFGDKVSLDFVTRYQVTSYLSPGFELNGFYGAKDIDHDDKFSRPETSLLDNTDNTGLVSLSVTPSLQIRIPKTGGSLDLKFQKPIYQNVRGIQQVVDWRAIASVVWAF